MNKAEITSFMDFINLTDGQDLFADLMLYRGQPVRGKLLPKIARKDSRIDTTLEEKKMLEQLKLQGASMVDHAVSSDLDHIILAQHYGMATRLLDWTSSPLTALWFACSDSKPGDTYVYALEADTLLQEDVYEKDPFTPNKTRVFQPRMNNSRIIAQQGWFTLHRYAKTNGRFVALEKNKQTKRHLYEYRIPKAQRSEMLDSLERQGVSAKTVFSDLGGLCQHLNRKHRIE